MGQTSAVQHRLANDGDGDQPGDEDQDNSHDIDNDSFADYKHVPDNSVYHDEDDRSAQAFGHAANAHEARPVVTLVERYYTAALAQNGAVGCSLLDPGLVRAAPLDYGKFGPVYLRGAKTCAAVLSREFAHAHAQLSSPIEITDVRLSGDRGYVFFGSESLPASDISVMRVGAVWKMGQLLGSPLT